MRIAQDQNEIFSANKMLCPFYVRASVGRNISSPSPALFAFAAGSYFTDIFDYNATTFNVKLSNVLTYLFRRFLLTSKEILVVK